MIKRYINKERAEKDQEDKDDKDDKIMSGTDLKQAYR